MNRRVIVTGATGLIGEALCRRLDEWGYDVVVFARDLLDAQRRVPRAAEYVQWSATDLTGEWLRAIDGAHAVINLAGAPIAGAPLIGPRWNTKYKRLLRDSRVMATRGLVDAIGLAAHKPTVLINGSAVGYYGPHRDEVLDESAPAGDDFLGRMCVEWEAEALKAEAAGVRVSLVRTGIVLDGKRGSLPLLALPYKLFVGGPVLPGSQYIPWIHLDDEVGIILKALEDPTISGPINASAPQPLTNREFGKVLAKTLHRPALFPVPGFMLRLLLGEAAQIITTGQRVIPARAEAAGYAFQFASAEAALHDIYIATPASRRPPAPVLSS